jgi:hypothetical protein
MTNFTCKIKLSANHSTAAATIKADKTDTTGTFYFLTDCHGFLVGRDGIVYRDSRTATVIGTIKGCYIFGGMNGDTYEAINAWDDLKALNYRGHTMENYLRPISTLSAVADPDGTYPEIVTYPPHNFGDYTDKYCAKTTPCERFLARNPMYTVADFIVSSEAREAAKVWSACGSLTQPRMTYEAYVNHIYFGADANAAPGTSRAIDNIDKLALVADAFLPGMIVDWAGAQFDLPTPAGWWPCDGTMIAAPGSVLTGKIAPDYRGRVLAGAAQANRPGTFGGKDAYMIGAQQLPVINIASSGAFKPRGELAINGSDATAGGWPAICTQGSAQRYGFDYIAGNTYGLPMVPGSADIRAISTAHGHSGSLAGYNDPVHVSAELNPYGSQIPIDTRQATAYVTKLIKL